MRDLRSRLLNSFYRQVPAGQPVGVLFSGGIDSVTGTATVAASGRPFQLYTFELEGLRSREVHKAATIARHHGWPLKILTIPAAPIADDFRRLILLNRCRTKVQVEVTYGLSYAFPAIAETYVITCLNADRYYGNSRQIVLEQGRLRRQGVSIRERKKRFDAWRQSRLAIAQDLKSGDSWGFAVRAAEGCGKRLIDLYLDPAIAALLFQYDHDQLSSPAKPLIRRAFGKEVDDLPKGSISVGVRMQIGARVDERMAELLGHPAINRFEPKARTTLNLCQCWAREAAANRDAFEQELRSLSPQPRAHVRPACQAYEPYLMARVRDASRRRRFTVITTFGGGGGSSIGYRLAGGHVCGANEFVPEAANTYRRNFPEVVVETSNIRDLLKPARLAAFLNSAGVQPGEIDIVDGSPPCSEFSIAGSGIGDQDVPKRYSDVKQAGIATLPLAFRDFVHSVRPKAFVMENVPNLASRTNHDFLDYILQCLRLVGPERLYYVACSIRSSSDHGVPQRRERLIVVGVRIDVANLIGLHSDESILRLFPLPSHGMVTIRSALRDLRQKDRDIEPWLKAPRNTGLGTLIRQLPKDPPKLTRLPNAKKNFTLTRCSWDLPAPTLVVMGQQPNGLSGAIHPEEDRKFTLPELKRLFALPDDFVLTGTVSQAAERICRMVPPLLTKAIAEGIYEKVLLPYREAVNAL